MVNLLRWCARIAGIVALLLGLLLWAGKLASALNAHMALGAIVAAALALLAVYAIVARARVPLAVVGLLWAGATVWVGINQIQWLPGGNHWMIGAIHLLLGIGAIGLAEALAGAIRRAA